MLPELLSERRVFDGVGMGICVADAVSHDLPLIYVNQPFLTMSGYAEHEVLGRNCRFMQGDDRDQEAILAIREALREKRTVVETLRNRRKDGSVFWNELQLSPLFDSAGELTHYIGVQNDVTSRVEREKHLAHYAERDPLTGLATRAVMMKRLDALFASARREGEQVAILFVDLDGFKAINDTFGHESGDRVLQIFAKRIRSVIRDNDCAARIGGDEFVLIAGGLGSGHALDLLRHRLMVEIEKPMVVYDQLCSVTASIGAAIFPTDATLPRDLLHLADTAMYADKRARQDAASARCATV